MNERDWSASFKSSEINERDWTALGGDGEAGGGGRGGARGRLAAGASLSGWICDDCEPGRGGARGERSRVQLQLLRPSSRFRLSAG